MRRKQQSTKQISKYYQHDTKMEKLYLTEHFSNDNMFKSVYL